MIEQSPQPVRMDGPLKGPLPPKSLKPPKEDSNIPVPSYKDPKFLGTPEKNTNIPKTPPQVEAVVKIGSVVRKPNVLKRFKSTFIQEDLKTAALFLLADRVVPGIKEGALKLLELVLFGSTSSGSRSVRRDDRGRTNYNGISSSYVRDSRTKETERERLERERDERYRRANHDFDDIKFDSRDAADRVLDVMKDHIEEYGKVTVGAFYSLCGLVPEYTDEAYGWDDMRDMVEPVRGRHGYVLPLPKPKRVD